MLFRQKERVPDIGKHNFREFMRREDDSCMNTQNILPIFSNSTIQAQTKQSQTPQALDGSIKMLGNTWDAQHLGKFLQHSQFAQLGARTMKMGDTQQNMTMKNQSFYFRSQQPRLIEDNVDYLHQHPINHLITQHPLQSTSQSFLKKKLLQIPEKQFDETKINYQTQPELKRPEDYRKDLQEAKSNQVKYHQWRSQFQDVNKAYKKAKLGFKSGLYALDNPNNEQTELYREEHEKLKKQDEHKTTQHFKRFKSLERFNCSNPSIEFDNVRHIKNQPNPEDPLLHQGQFPSKNFEMHKDWMKKRSGNSNFDTQNRIFGKTDNDRKVNTFRAQYLKDQEMRGREYNAITLVKE
ncbi:unnamed protein product [Paramecium sonneborni]|uniref:Uncharacterized protein n=1 Tax=Paramecium sonneborni TaxID=65129 RepID=A0A8S1PIV3_9CILI|nr:unnamed protein product [Paramecium sonneborni]